MRRRLKSLGDFRVYKAQSTMYAEPQDDAAAAHMDEAFERVKKIFGIAAVSRAAVCEKTFASISATAVGIPARRAFGRGHLQGERQALGQGLSAEQHGDWPRAGRRAAGRLPAFEGGTCMPGR